MTASDRAAVWRLPGLPDSELLRARHTAQSFARHTHQQFALGVIEAGGLAFDYRGEQWLAPAGSISLCLPGEAHTGRGATAEGWTYRMFYLDPALLREAAGDQAGRPGALPDFPAGVIADPALARRIRALHAESERGEVASLEAESRLLALLAEAMAHHARPLRDMAPAGREPVAVARVKDYLEAHYAEPVALDELARLAGLSRFHLLRVFCAAEGVPPHAYLRQVRLRQAKALLARGEPIAGAAAAAGFADQSHLTRWLKRLWGFTPAEYRNSLQDRGA